MVDVVDDGLVQDLELAAENALARVAELEKRVAELETENGLRCAQLAMLGSEICGDPKLDPDDFGDPRWTPALREARALRERAQRAEAWKRLAKRLRARLLNATDAVAALARVLDKESKGASHNE